MSTGAIMGRIAYKRGVLLAMGVAGEDAPEAACQVVRFERGILLVRVEEDVDFLEAGLGLQLEVPAEQAALYRIQGTVKELVSASDGTPIALIKVDDFEIIQRRKQERFEVNYACSFSVLSGAEKATSKATSTDDGLAGVGKVTDISLGGAELETEMVLSAGDTIQLSVRVPSGHLDFTGRLVKAIMGPTGVYRYGVRITSIDNFSWFLLNRLVLQLERKERRRRQMDAMSVTARSAVQRRALREPRRRWER